MQASIATSTKWTALDEVLMPGVYKYNGQTSFVSSYFLVRNDSNGYDLIVERVESGRRKKLGSFDEYGIGATSAVENHVGTTA